jgi:initiation factor 1A
MYQTSIRNKKKNQMFYKNKESSYDFDEEEEEYAYVINTLGNCRVTVITNSSIKTIGIIRGSLRNYKNRVLIEKGNIVIVSKNNETADKKVYIVHKLNPEQINNLIAEQKLSNTIINYYNGMHSVNIDENELININDNLNFT